MDIINDKIEDYIDELRNHRSPVLKEMEEEALETDFPIIGPTVGALLSILTRLSGAKRVMELGSGFGYSALWFALALPEDGNVVCTDFSEDLRDRALGYFERADQAHKLRYLVGDGLNHLRSTDGVFDIILNDIDKQDYPKSIPLVEKKLRENGIFITDNTLWMGWVTRVPPDDATTEGVRRFNEIMSDSREWESVLLPVRDGIMVARRK